MELLWGCGMLLLLLCFVFVCLGLRFVIGMWWCLCLLCCFGCCRCMWFGCLYCWDCLLFGFGWFGSCRCIGCCMVWGFCVLLLLFLWCSLLGLFCFFLWNSLSLLWYSFLLLLFLRYGLLWGRGLVLLCLWFGFLCCRIGLLLWCF